MTRPHILPPNASAMMRAVDQAAPAWDALPALRGPLWGHPLALAPWLASEWALAPLARYFADTGTLIAAGQPWLLERGTARAVRRALGWIGLPGAVCVEDGPYLHIRFARPPAPAQLPAIVHLATASIPAHVRLWRIFGGDDPRVLRLDAGPALDSGVLDNDGGAWLPTDPPILGHFTQRHAVLAPRPPRGQPQGMRTDAWAGRHVHDDSWRLDAWRLDSRVLVDAFGGVGQLTSRLGMAWHAPAPQGSAAVAHTTRRELVPAAAGQPKGLRERASVQLAPVLLPVPRAWTGAWAGPWRPSLIRGKRTDETRP